MSLVRILFFSKKISYLFTLSLVTFTLYTPLLSIAGQGEEFSVLGVCFCGSDLHEHGSKQQPHKARDKMGKDGKGSERRNLLCPSRGYEHLKT